MVREASPIFFGCAVCRPCYRILSPLLCLSIKAVPPRAYGVAELWWHHIQIVLVKSFSVDMEKPTQDQGQLSLAGSRSLLKQLRPKGTSNALLQHSERNDGDSSSGDEHVRPSEIIDLAVRDSKNRKSCRESILRTM